MPRRECCVFGCHQFDVLHRFPKPETSLERFLEWKKIVGSKLEDKTNDDIYTNCRICNNHFEERFFYPQSKRLAKTSFPTLNLGFISSNQDESIEIQSVPEVLSESMDIDMVPQILPGCSSQVPNPELVTKTGKISKVKQTKQMEIMIKKIDYLKKKLNVQKDQIKAAQKMSKTKLFKKIVKSLSVPTQTFVNMQLTQYKKKNRGRRFSIKDKLLALAIYKKSPKGYNFLRKIFVIPSKRTLQNVLKQITLKPGLNPVIFEQIKNATEKFNTEQRLCILMFDEMALSPAMNLNIPADQIIGFEDFGKDVNSNQTENIADHVETSSTSRMYRHS
ncbi:hypothetical protein HW555_007016 [Spodoptera exigua]|uniref:THAP-type domain-containing protein n=1 Tax=Spodoptera exigua TaxID=7107 RepID=A0A835L308_SPOEX|nr:hypothetical protein HW555_007016 [Spodoptera exigua]